MNEPMPYVTDEFLASLAVGDRLEVAFDCEPCRGVVESTYVLEVGRRPCNEPWAMARHGNSALVLCRRDKARRTT